MSNSNHTAEVSFIQAFRKDAGSYVIPVLIVLAAIFISMGNLFSAQADETPAPTVSISQSTPEAVTVSGAAGFTISGASGANLDR